MGTTREELVLATLDSICRRANEVVFALYPDVSELKVVQSENGKAQVHYVTQINDRWFRDEAVHTTLARICQEVEEGMFSWYSGLREFKIVRREDGKPQIDMSEEDDLILFGSPPWGKIDTERLQRERPLLRIEHYEIRDEHGEVSSRFAVFCDLYKKPETNYGLFAEGFNTREDAEQYIANYGSGNY
jgi:hypothetical protein